MATDNKSTFDKFQALMTILTPILVIAAGAFLNQNITRVESEIKNVAAMKEFFEDIAGNDVGKAKMAAYALYMLNKENPEMAVSMIMAPDNDDLMAVLVDLGKRDAKISDEVKKILETQDDRQKQTTKQKNAQKIIGQLGDSWSAEGARQVAATAEIEGWAYLGDFDADSGTRIALEKGQLPKKGMSYPLVFDTNLRADKPKPPNYGLASVVGVASEGKAIMINDLDIDSKNRVWAQVSVSSR